MVLALLLSISVLLAGCGSSNTSKLSADKVNVVTTFYPLYYIAQEIGGDAVNVINLIPTGVEPHDWTPKSLDLQHASNAQLLIYQGSGFEGWFPDFQKGLSSDSSVRIVEASKGIQLIHTDEEDEYGAHDDHGHEAGDTDPHTWVSPKSALVMAENVRNALVEVDSSHKADMEARYQVLKEKLIALDKKYEQELSQVQKREIVVSHHAFGYLARDYNLEQHALMGISGDSEPRAQDIIYLTKLVKEKGIGYIFFEELGSDSIANLIASEAGVETLILNPLEGITTKQEKNGDNYITLMERNLNNLVQALQ